MSIYYADYTQQHVFEYVNPFLTGGSSAPLQTGAGGEGQQKASGSIRSSAYEEVRPTLTTKLCDLEYNQEYLTDKPWKPCGPFAVFYRARIGSTEESSEPVTNAHMDAWGITKEQLHADAIEAEITAQYPPRDAFPWMRLPQSVPVQ